MIHNTIDRRIDNATRKSDKNSIIGTVTNVYDKQSGDREEGNIEVNIQTRNGRSELRRIPVLEFDHVGHVCVPQEGDFVIVDFLRGGNNGNSGPYVTGTVYTDKTRAPMAREGHWRHEFGDPSDPEKVYLEAEPADGSGGEPDLLRLGVKEDGLSEPSTEVAVDNSGETTQVRIHTDGDVSASADGEIELEGAQDLSIAIDGDTNLEVGGNVDATIEGDIETTVDGNVDATVDGDLSADVENDVDVDADGDAHLNAQGQILIGPEGQATPVARADHTHSFTYNGGGDNSSSRSGTTDSPSQDGTDTEIA